MGKKNADEMLFWTNEEFKVFIKAMEDRPIGYTVFMVMYYTGLRVGELSRPGCSVVKWTGGFVGRSRTRMSGGRGE